MAEYAEEKIKTGSPAEAASAGAAIVDAGHQSEQLYRSRLPEIIEQSLFVKLFSEYDFFFGVCLRELYRRRPDLLASLSKQISFDELIKFESIEDTEVFKALVNSGSPSESKNIGNAIAKIAPDTIANVKDNAKLKIVDKATTPKAPTSPNVSRNVMIAFAAGIIISLIISFVRDILDVKIKYNDEMTTVLDLPLLAAIPDFEYFSNQKAAEKKYGDYESGY